MTKISPKIWILVGISIGLSIAVIFAFYMFYMQVKFQQGVNECEARCDAQGIGWSICKFLLSEGCYCWKPKLLGIGGYECIKIF